MRQKFAETRLLEKQKAFIHQLHSKIQTREQKNKKERLEQLLGLRVEKAINKKKKKRGASVYTNSTIKMLSLANPDGSLIQQKIKLHFANKL